MIRGSANQAAADADVIDSWRRLVVVDSSALIGLAAAGEFQLLRLLFGAVVITTAVRDEVLAAPSLPGSAEVEQAQADGWLTMVDAHQIGTSLSRTVSHWRFVVRPRYARYSATSWEMR